MSIKVIYSAISLINVKTIETIQVLHVEITMILLLRMITRFNNNEGENANINFNWIMANWKF